ncbi:uncharacterized protein KRP23_1643 [Phytophthora ramorum]|uniref:uncharacterized protein n=1 Tax=Phytophthora ramorum TaxID=164328 RepID=UPI003094ECA1|nr:hypothetical protein KRP23_1643 [Phytophthora ramorum]
MEKKQPWSPFDVLGPNGNIYHCGVEMIQEESVIRLVNQTTGDKWKCHVTSSNVNSFRSKKCTELRLRGLRQVVVAILQEALKGNIGPRVSSYAANEDWYTLCLKQKYSKYFMKLKLECQIDGMKGSWSFPMNPDDPGAIQKRDRRLVKYIRESATLPEEAPADLTAQKRMRLTRQPVLRTSKSGSQPVTKASTTQKSVGMLQGMNRQQRRLTNVQTT